MKNNNRTTSLLVPVAVSTFWANAFVGILLLVFLAFGSIYLAAAHTPWPILRDRVIPVVYPSDPSTFTPYFYQSMHVADYDALVRRRFLFFGWTAILLDVILLGFLRPLIRAIRVCLTDGFRLIEGLRQWRKGVASIEWLVLLVLTTVAANLRLRYIRQPMRYDEATTYLSYASKPFYVLLSVYAAPNNHVFHTILVRFAYLLFGNLNWALRLPALIFGICLVPATYVVARSCHSHAAAALSAGLVAASSSMIEYSTYARGYTIVCFLSLLLFWLAMQLSRQHNWAGWVLLGLLSSLGFYTIPIMLYPYATAVVWLFLSCFLGDTNLTPRMFMEGLVVSSSCAVCAAFWLYSPIFIISATGSVFANYYVKNLSASVFLTRLPFSLRSTAHSWVRDWPVALATLLGLGFLASLIWSRQCCRFRIALPLAMSVAIVPLLLIQRVVPFERVWLFALPVFLASSSAGLVLIFSQAGRHLRFSRLSPVLVALIIVWASISVYQGKSVYMINEGRGLEQATGFLKATLIPGDSVLSGFLEKRSLTYYFDLAGVNLHYVDAPPSDRVFVVVSEVGGETLSEILGLAEIPALCAGRAKRIGEFDPVSIYEMTSAAPKSSADFGCASP